MPAFEYVCTNCETREVRITGIDDHTALCDGCGQVMVRRVDLDALLASYKTASRQSQVTR